MFSTSSNIEQPLDLWTLSFVIQGEEGMILDRHVELRLGLKPVFWFGVRTPFRLLCRPTLCRRGPRFVAFCRHSRAVTLAWLVRGMRWQDIADRAVRLFFDAVSTPCLHLFASIRQRQEPIAFRHSAQRLR